MPRKMARPITDAMQKRAPPAASRNACDDDAFVTSATIVEHARQSPTTLRSSELRRTSSEHSITMDLIASSAVTLRLDTRLGPAAASTGPTEDSLSSA